MDRSQEIIRIGSLHINVYDTMSAHDIHGLTRRISTAMYERHGIIVVDHNYTE